MTPALQAALAEAFGLVALALASGGAGWFFRDVVESTHDREEQDR